MERIVTMVAAVGALVAASLSAYAAYSIKDDLASQIRDEKARQALSDLESFDKEISKSVAGFSCVNLAAYAPDEDAKGAIFAGKKFVGPIVAGCREKDREVLPSGYVRYTGNDARSIRRQNIKLLSNFDRLFASVEAGLSDCQTIEVRFGEHLADRLDIYMASLKAAEASDEALRFPAFKSYLSGGCQVLG